MSGMLDKLHRKHQIELNAAVNETADMVEADTRDMEYTIAKFEERLEQVVGPYYVPRSERYG